jgi:hypothetical protein
MQSAVVATYGLNLYRNFRVGRQQSRYLKILRFHKTRQENNRSGQPTWLSVLIAFCCLLPTLALGPLVSDVIQMLVAKRLRAKRLSTLQVHCREQARGMNGPACGSQRDI